MKEILLGSHIGMHSPDYLLGSAIEAVSYGCNCFMIYTGAPQNTKRIDLNFLKIDEYISYLKKNNIDPKNVIVHAPYILNLATNDLDKLFTAKSILLNELNRTKAIGSKYIVLHPGYATTCDRQTAIKNIGNAINELNEKCPDIVICLETMAGKGSEIGRDFVEIAKIIDFVNNKKCICVLIHVMLMIVG